MGQWNRRRWWSRKRNFYQEDDVHMKHCYNFETQIEPSEYEDNIPSWEKQFCKFASVPWGKVLFVKKYMHMHEEILKWNDSSGEEAFNNAKQRFWADINGIPCDICLPDPDMYIEKNIDWDTSIDPELIASLDLVFFDVDKTTDWNAANEKTTNSNQEQKMPSNVQNPWEPTDGAEKDVGTSWGQGHSQSNNKESSLKEENRWNQGWDQNNNTNNGGFGWEPTKSGYDNGWGDDQNPWEPIDRAEKDVGTSWGQGHSQSNNKKIGLKEEKRWTRGWDQNNNTNNGGFGREPTKSGYDNGWVDYNNNHWGNSSKDFVRPNGGAWRPANDNSRRKREWTDQDASRYKTFRSDDRSNNNNWRGRSDERSNYNNRRGRSDDRSNNNNWRGRPPMSRQ